ncbi:hypothetical protein LGR54_09575 [Ancylobacter sp. Lp-2]|uniref:hypothetical protein n=1 Tax=Ancylobacter sp. Lp-2 TaxID=2881339 RepID=UPI001E40A7AC|nr:hypothetical protein [Ancylobacter sp. Lp-2]MCB4768852.1 hypothetical protein [Ancylobacter sp. Lp-2]
MSNRTSGDDAPDDRASASRQARSLRAGERRRWWQRSWGAALMLAGAALLMGLVLTVWSEAALFGG